MQNIFNLTGKAAVFVRGFMDYFGDQEEKGKAPVPLRECQDAGKQAVVDLGEDISVAYISKLGREITKARVLKKVKKGRKYYLQSTDETENYWVALEMDEKYGTDINPDAMAELQQRTSLLDYMKKYRGIVIPFDEQLPKAQYNLLMKQFNEGKLKMAFVDAEMNVFIDKDPEPYGAWDRVGTIDEAPDRYDPEEVARLEAKYKSKKAARK